MLDDGIDHVAVVLDEWVKRIDAMCCRDLDFTDDIAGGGAVRGLAIGTRVATGGGRWKAVCG